MKDLLQDKIKPAMEALFASMQNMFTLWMEEILDQKMQVLANIQAELIYQVVNQLIQDNTQLQRQVRDFTIEIPSMVAAKTTPTWPRAVMATILLPLQRFLTRRWQQQPQKNSVIGSAQPEKLHSSAHRQPRNPVHPWHPLQPRYTQANRYPPARQRHPSLQDPSRA